MFEKGTAGELMLRTVYDEVKGLFTGLDRAWTDAASGCHTMTEMKAMHAGLKDSRLNYYAHGTPADSLHEPMMRMYIESRKSVCDALEKQPVENPWGNYFKNTSSVNFQAGSRNVLLEIEPSGDFLVNKDPDSTRTVQATERRTVTGQKVTVVGSYMDGPEGGEGHWEWCTVDQPVDTEASGKTELRGCRRSRFVATVTRRLGKALRV